ncbi:MAG TPA: hypothetical protein VF399_07755 [bacterium]
MKLENIKMPGFNTSLMGVIKGVLDHYQFKISDAKAFSGSGHAFLINVHEVICPSGPYCWKRDGFVKLVKNLGLEMIDLGFISAESSAEDRRKLEQSVIGYLDKGVPCSVENMDNQIIYGYENDKLLLVQPWGSEVDITPPALTFGTWQEFGKEIHANFYAFKKIDKKDDTIIIKESLIYGVDLFENPSKYSWEKYRIGLAAYDNWAQGVENGHGTEHGNWWNGMVWSECRNMASAYLAEIAGTLTGKPSKAATHLSSMYKDIASNLAKISDKKMAAPDKLQIIKELKVQEEKAVKGIKELLAVL